MIKASLLWPCESADVAYLNRLAESINAGLGRPCASADAEASHGGDEAARVDASQPVRTDSALVLLRLAQPLRGDVHGRGHRFALGL